MNGSVFVVFAAGVLTVFGLIVYANYLAAKKRREALAGLAAARGWTYAARDDRYVDQFSGAPFGLGHGRRAENVLTGNHEGRSFVAFDYCYYTTETSTDAQGHTSSREQAHPYSVIALNLGAAVPVLSVTPEGFFGRIVGRLTNSDIELESEAFNRAFTVHCEDRKFATDVLHPRMMEYLLKNPELGWSLRDRSLLLVHANRHTLAELDAKLLVGDGILDQVPGFVREQYGLPNPPSATAP